MAQTTKNGYVCFYKNKRIDVRADSTLEAQNIASKQLKVKKSWLVTCVLAEKDGKEVIHRAVD